MRSHPDVPHVRSTPTAAATGGQRVSLPPSPPSGAVDMAGRPPGAVRVGLGHQPGLDGLRALSIIAVLLYHGGVSWAGGGFLGVESFFVLSGFLITSLLIAEWCQSSRIRLGAFWARRARRLLPALLALVCVIGVYYTLAGPLKAIPGLESSGIATLLYVGNWHQIAIGSNYFVASGPVSPFQHTWSLAIEEQFYLLWPLLLVAVFWLISRGRRGAGNGPEGRAAVQRRSLAMLLAATVTAAVASAVDTAILYHGGSGLERVYYGTDTRATGLLVGASLAIAIALTRLRGTRPAMAGKVRGRLAVVGFVLVVVAMHDANGESGWLFPWGLVGVDLAVASVIAAVVLVPCSMIARLFSVRPLCAIGAISYGLYLWHFPCFLWLNADSTGATGAGLLFIRLAVTVTIATVSFILIEQPVRRRRVPSWVLRPMVPVAVAASFTSLIAAAAVDAQVPGSQLAPIPAGVTAQLAGHDRSCAVALRDTPQYRTVPLPKSALGGYIFHWILRGTVDWNGGGYPQSTQTTYRTCPPKRVLILGDSIAYTAGVPMLENENRYGVELANAAILGCAFGNRGMIDVNGTYKALPPQCPDDLSRWERAARAFGAQVVVVELGYRDEFDWRWDGHVVHLGQRSFDAYVQQRIDRFASVLSAGGARVLFLTVPYVNPPALASGAPAPAGDPVRHALIDSMLQTAAAHDPSHVGVLDIDRIVSPGGHYDETVNGQDCRFDGIHFSIYCASLLQPSVLSAARDLIDR
jgi:peptidoglycan/LPS O-acetylase OafA/YrhL